jgi:8-amino-7-oxononanoate synthase
MRDPDGELAELEARDLRRHLKPLAGPQRPWMVSGGRGLLNFSSNDYLGLADHPAIKQACIDGIGRFGAGAGAARLVSGSLAVHHELEEALAAANHAGAALLFASGYACALGTIPALVGKGDVILLDKLCHASLIDGARLSGATVRVFPHQHLGKLERLLSGQRRALPAAARILVVTESVFSMDGDVAPLAEMVALKDAHGALLLLDEAHGFGVLGPTGMGLAEAAGVAARIDVHLGTLSKAAGLAGGYVAASRGIIDLLVNRARSFIFSTATPPALAHAGLAALELIRGAEGTELRGILASHRQALAARLGTAPPPAAIFPLILGEAAAALAAARVLDDHGFLVPAIRHPTVPLGAARLRVTLSAAHRAADVAALAEALAGICENPSRRRSADEPSL